MDLFNNTWITDEPIILATDRTKLYILLQSAGFIVDVVDNEATIICDKDIRKGHIGCITKKIFLLYYTSRDNMRFDSGEVITYTLSVEQLREELVKIINSKVCQ